MAFNNLPPQAYTRDTLVAAYEWLQSQPGSIREMAQNPNALVGLYLQSKRRVTPPPATMPSTDAFKKDLQTLAEGLKQFEDPRAQAPVPPPVQHSVPPPVQHSVQLPPQPQYSAPLQQTPAQHSALHSAPQFTQPHIQQPQPAQQTPAQNSVQQTPTPAPAPAAPIQPAPTAPTQTPTPAGLDARTKKILAETKERLNLSSEAEALRLLVTLGYEKLSAALPAALPNTRPPHSSES